MLVSRALPKAPSVDPADKRIALHVDNHPLSYTGFDGTIPPQQFDAGTVIVLGNGRREPTGDPAEGLTKGELLSKPACERLSFQSANPCSKDRTTSHSLTAAMDALSLNAQAKRHIAR